MATYTVTTLDDIVDDLDGLTSLREAVALANADVFIDTITFAAAGTITLSSTLDVTEMVTINGDIGDDHTADITIDGGGTVQLFDATAAIALQGLVLTHGHSDLDGGAITSTGAVVIVDSSLIDNTALASGGGVSASGDVAIVNSTLSGNSADSGGGGAVAAGGTLTLTDSSLVNNSALADGGGAYVNGSVTITGSTVANNAGGHGGGINTVGALTATDSTFSGNTSTGLGGAVNASLDVTLTNTTVADNAALIGGGVSTFGAFSATNATFSGNAADISAGAVKAFDTITATNSIFLGDTAVSAESELDGASLIYQGLNIVGTGSDTDASDHVINAATIGTVLVTDLAAKAVLADNGGPVKTIALVDAAGNPALDASNASGTATDARGAAAFDRADVANTQGSARDLGAYEGTDPPATYTVTNLNDSGAGSLRDAIALANAHFGADTISFAAGLAGGTITLASTLEVTDAVTINGDIDGNHVADLTLDGDNAVQILRSTDSLELRGLILTHGNNLIDHGGAVAMTNSIFEVLTIVDCQIVGNTAIGAGGGVFSFWDLDVTSTTFSNNQSTGNGGGGAGASHTITITRSTFDSNSGNNGGGVWGADVTIVDSTFSGNTANGGGNSGDGGGALASHFVNVTNSTFSGNTATDEGGGAFGNGAIATNSIFLGNSALGGYDDVEGSESFYGLTYVGLNIVGIGADTDKSDNVVNAASLGAVFVLGSDGKALLADNGGLVKTIALVNSITNPALDASDTSAPATDARGRSTFDIAAIANAQGSARDLGAYEFASANVLPTLTLTKTAGDFSNTTNTTAAIKVAKIALTDPDSTPVLSLSGADANLFQIKGNALYLKAGTTLNALANPSLDVTVRADDPANGAGVDVSKSLSFKVLPVIKATPGNDRLVGTDKADVINGLAGNDLLTGGGGRDLLTGGKGADTFIFKTLSDSKAGGLRDVITDFTDGQDHIDLRGIDANTAKAGNQAFTFIASQGFHKTAGELRAVVTDHAGTFDDRTVLSGDVNGDGKADFQIELTGAIRLDVGDFYL